MHSEKASSWASFDKEDVKLFAKAIAKQQKNDRAIANLLLNPYH